jgi:hypothetical protein
MPENQPASLKKGNNTAINLGIECPVLPRAVAF